MRVPEYSRYHVARYDHIFSCAPVRKIEHRAPVVALTDPGPPGKPEAAPIYYGARCAG